MKINIDSVFYEPKEPPFIHIEGRNWKSDEPMEIRVHHNEGVHVWNTEAGQETDFRSGGRAIDCIAPWIGNTDMMISWYCHDLAYRSKYISKKLADAILIQMLKRAGLSSWRAWMVGAGLKIGGTPAYEDVEDSSKIKFRWPAKR